MTNPTPVAWMTTYMHEGNPQICVMVHPPHPHSDLAKQPHTTNELFTLDQLNKARADALREAAERFDGCYVTSNHPQIGYGIAAELRRMAAEVEGEK